MFGLRVCLILLVAGAPCWADQASGWNAVTTFKGAEELPASAQALLRQRFPGWSLEWLANVRSGQSCYSLLYGIRGPLSAMILTLTDLETDLSNVIKADNSLFPFQAGHGPPSAVRVALAEALVRKNAAPYGSINGYVAALRRYDMIRFLAAEQKEAIVKLGGKLPRGQAGKGTQLIGP